MNTPYTTDLCDALGEQAQALSPNYRHFGGRRHFAGQVVTVKCFEDSSRVKELIATPGQGRVLVVDAGGSTRCAVWGDQSGQTAVANGWAGVVIYGACRDAARNAELPLGLLALACVPRKSDRRGAGTTDVAVDLGGTSVRPGDQVIVDEDGAVIVPAIAWSAFVQGAK